MSPPAGSTDKKENPWKRMVAGAVAGTADVWACHPLDRIKTQLQNNPGRSIYQTFTDVTSKGKGFTGGVYALYEGILPMTAEAIFKVGIRYFAFSWFTKEYNERFNGGKAPKDPFFVNLAGGAFAGTVESFLVVIPCELLKVRHMTQAHSRSFGNVFRDVWREEGIQGLYKGGSATLLRQITNHMIRFPVFYAITDSLKGGDHSKKLPVLQNLAAGALAGTASTLFNNPLDTIKTRMQKQGQNQTSTQVIRSIYADGGVSAFWAGCLPRILRVAPGQAITWAVVEWVTNLLGP
ncbi:hypothetical protein SAMD00019534_055490, partial [Acytostelium subglobosum LB1]|uniref:hypothetical protein n=1 Tax=Acytostelium subglobosum LB1 TaxID=1410327 RepID=UPI0006451FF0